MLRTFALCGMLVILLGSGQMPAQASEPQPQRPLPEPRQVPLAMGPKKFVDAKNGNDSADGSEATPWKSLRHATRQLRPGDTLYLRGGVYYERVSLTRSGTAEAPITIASYPGELATIDGGLHEFVDDPAGSWQPFAGGAADEYVSTRSYLDADERIAPDQFLPASHEPMWGKEDERPLALGHFAKSLVPLHGYRIVEDLRSTNELWLGNKNEMRDTGIYGGPGLWFNRETGRIHIRLAHHRLAGLGDRAYRGETDPRRVPLVVSVGFGRDVLRATGVSHVNLRDLVFRGATGSAMIHIYGSQQLALDHVTIYGGFPAFLINASQDIRVTHSAVRGLAAPWTSRAHMKYRGSASYQVVLRNNQPINENIEFAHCEFTDDHDFGFFRFVKNLQFHHNLVDNFNDDGLECGPKLRAHSMYLWQNRIGRVLIPLSQHEFEKDESPVDHDPQSGVFAFRNVIDLRGGTYKSPPGEADPSGAFLHQEGHLMGDHGSPVWPVLRFYHNTVLRETPTFRDAYLFGLGAGGLRHNERDVFNNIFVQTDRVPGVGFIGVTGSERLREGGNLLWGLQQGPNLSGDPYAKFRASKVFEQSRGQYPAGWTSQDLIADPKFARLTADRTQPVDLQLQTGSPAIGAGQKLPEAWPDPLRQTSGGPDLGAVPRGVNPWGVGIDGRVPLFGN
ncbi:MAG: hypothetical protein JNM18_24570 [Planctomycetaceae bacterium]|nr:hypothetical protein [Planctomycetaceae bacterium]